MLLGMTTLGTLLKGGQVSIAPPPPDIPSLVASLMTTYTPAAMTLGGPQSMTAAMRAWIEQDDDAHEPCSLTACRHPLHPGPCKGWKGTLHSVSPGTYHQLEGERVRKANERRLKRIADLKAQGKPIPRNLLQEIKPKAPPAKQLGPVAPGQVGQKADLAGGQAHQASQAISNAAGVKPNVPLPLGPKQKKPSVAGRGPAFVITQPKVTDQYKLDKAAKITPQEWDSLSAADKKAIRDELTAIKSRGFGPQQTKADALLAKLPAASTVGTLKPGTPGTITTPKGNTHQVINAPSQTPSAAPGKTTLGQATKTPSKPASAPAAPAPAAPSGPPISIPKTASPLGTQKLLQKVGALDITFAPGTSAEKSFKDVGVTGDHEHYLVNKGAGSWYITDKNGKNLQFLSKQEALHLAWPKNAQNAPSTPAPKAPAAPTAPAPGSAPKVLSPDAQHARAVAGRGIGRPTSKAHVDAYGKLTKADFDSLDANTQRTIRDDLANAKAKFLDPAKKKTAQDLLDRFGAKHTSPAPGAPNVPAHPKGYSDPQQQAMKAVHGSDTDDTLKRVGALSPTAVKGLDDGDRKTLLSRLAFIATHPKATPEQKARAAAYGRIINGGGYGIPAKRDHEPSLGELRAEEEKSGAAAQFKALVHARDKSGSRDDRIAALAALTKPQFDALSPDEKRQITDALQDLHQANAGSASSPVSVDHLAVETLKRFTGDHPAVYRAKQAEADFRAGKIDADKLHQEILTARVKMPTALKDALVKEEQRIAEDNPKLPLWLRAGLIDNKYGLPGGVYNAIANASMKHMWSDAPRLSPGDFDAIFRATQDELKAVHPIQAEAVNALRLHIITSGLAPGSPWSTATKDQLIGSFLDLRYGKHDISQEKIDEFFALPAPARIAVRKALEDRLAAQTNDHAKTGTWISLRALQGKGPLDPATKTAVDYASDRFASGQAHDAYRKMSPSEFQDLPTYVRAAINQHLDEFQKDAERGGPVLAFGPQDNALKAMPAALKAQLNGARTPYVDRSLRNASDVANYGTGIVSPADRVDLYQAVSIGRFRIMSRDDRDAILDDLGNIAARTGNPLRLRYEAQRTKDVTLGDIATAGLNADQIAAIVNVNPGIPSTDNDVRNALNDLTPTAFNKLNPIYRDAIDDRIKLLPGADQQIFNAKFHPSAPVTNPSGTTPTPAASVQPHVQEALDTIYGLHPKSHTMAHQLKTYGALRGSDFAQLNVQEQNHLLSDLSFIETTARGPSADKARKLIDRFTPAGTPSGQMPTPPAIPPANSVPGQVRYATPLKGTLVQATDKGQPGDGWTTTPGGRRVWGKYGAAGLMLMHQDPATGERRYLMVQRGPAISDPGKWQFPGGAIDSKETFHQGGTREVIEELGFKADALKDAEVHGEHTNAIPGSTWKYVSIAAQVPQMLKPDLSTSHARAETSDAKWMTEAEIRALDTSGKLLAPLAGGKLEQNVLSLFPTTSAPTKLGQVVRPGPVTKRQGRLSMPSGGRKPPSTFNAWPHAHKPSTGKDLMPDQAAKDKLRQDVKHARKAYDGKTGDGRLAAIGAMQGFDATPTVVSKAEIDRLLATGDYIEAWRGVKGTYGGKSAADINEDFRSGVAWYGRGIFGNGYYIATQKRVAEQYSDGRKNSIVRMLIPKSAVIEKYKKVQTEARKNPKMSKAKGSYEDGTLYDAGRWAAAKGIDGIQIDHDTVNDTGGWARHVAKPGLPAFNWINRAVLIVQEADK